MDPVTTTALATSALQVGSSIFGNRSKKHAEERQFQRQMALQHDAQAWQEQMSNTAHQREVADLEAAGLNPVLSAGGQGASGGGVGAGEAQMAQMESPDLSSVVQNAMSAKQQEAQIENIKADTIKKEKDSAKSESEKKLIDIKAKVEEPIANAKIRLDNAQSAKARQDIQESIARQLAIEFDNEMKGMNVKKRKSEFGREMNIYSKQVQKALLDAGYSLSETGQIVEKLGQMTRALVPLGDFMPNVQTSTYNQHDYYNVYNH